MLTRASIPYQGMVCAGTKDIYCAPGAGVEPASYRDPKSRRPCRQSTPDREPPPGAGPGHPRYKGGVTAVCGGMVCSARVELATSRYSAGPLYQLEYEHVEPPPGVEPGRLPYEGRAAAVRGGTRADAQPISSACGH